LNVSDRGLIKKKRQIVSVRADHSSPIKEFYPAVSQRGPHFSPVWFGHFKQEFSSLPPNHSSRMTAATPHGYGFGEFDGNMHDFDDQALIPYISTPSSPVKEKINFPPTFLQQVEHNASRTKDSDISQKGV
jgi:hypothetical protein